MIRKFIFALCMGLCCMACEEALPGYNTSWKGVQFVLPAVLHPEVYSYSFVGKGDISVDTVWFTVRPQGMVPEENCRIKLEQYEKREWKYIYGNDGIIADSVLTVYPRQAVPGVHYIPFDDERMKEHLILKPGELSTQIPVIMLRDESLRDTTYTLFFRIVDSEDLMAGDNEYCHIQLKIADCLTTPAAWNRYFFAGAWSRTKHEFMITISGKEWDDEFISTLSIDDKNYYLFIFNRELKKENAKRAEQGLPPLRDNPDDPATEITFPTIAR